MKINTQQHDVDANGMMAQRKFTVDAGAHIMAVLSGLYKNPVDAMVREYLTNMYDAYVALERLRPGSKVIPPTLHLPTALDGNLTFRDNGIGMSMDTVWNVYATYGASTKNGNNDEVGGFGLGSKTAFCYNGGASWTIESRYDGEKHVFMAFIGEDGVPNLSHVTTMPTDEHNGLTISIPIRREDHRAAYDAARRYVPYFPMALVVEGDTVPAVDYTIRGTGWGIRSNSATRWGTAEMRVIMGNVPYPVDFRGLGGVGRFDGVTDQYAITNFIERNGIDLWVNIGDVDIVPSRDDMKYTDRTKAAIRAALQKMIKDVPNELAKQLDGCDTEWSAIEKFGQIGKLYGIGDIIKSLKWRGQTISATSVTVKREAITALDPSATVVRYSIVDSHRASIEITENPDVVEMNVMADNTFIVADDLAKGGATVARALVYQKLVNKSSAGRSYRYGHTPGSAYLVKTKLTADKLAALFSGMPVTKVQSAATLKGVVPITAGSKATKDTIYRWSGTSWDARVNVPTGSTFYYLPLTKDNYTGRWAFVNNRYGTQKDAILTIRKAAHSLNIKYDTIYGIKADDVKNFDSSWVNLVDAMEAEVTNQITKNAQTFALATKVNLPQSYHTVYDAMIQAGIDKAVPEAGKFVADYTLVSNAKNAEIVNVAKGLTERIPTIVKHIETVTKSINVPDLPTTLKTMFKKHPMLEIVVNLCDVRFYGNERLELLKKNRSTLLAYVGQNV